MGGVVLFALTSAFNPTLVAVTTVMLLLPDPRRLLLGYWLGAMATSITLGLVIVFALEGSRSVSTTQRTLSPGADLALGGLLLALAIVLHGGHDQRVRERRRRDRTVERVPRWQRPLREGTTRTAFVLGALLTLPGASYLAGLSRLSRLGYSTVAEVVVVVAFNLVMLLLLEIPLLATVLAPERAQDLIDRGKAWVGAHGRRVAVVGFSIVGALLVLKGVIGLLAG